MTDAEKAAEKILIYFGDDPALSNCNAKIRAIASIISTECGYKQKKGLANELEVGRGFGESEQGYFRMDIPRWLYNQIRQLGADDYKRDSLIKQAIENVRAEMDGVALLDTLVKPESFRIVMEKAFEKLLTEYERLKKEVE